MKPRFVFRFSIVGVIFLSAFLTSDRVAAANQPPTASFASPPMIGFAPSAFIFDASGSSAPDGSIVSYAWNFGDGQTGTGVNLLHLYQTPGTFFPVLTVTDNDGLTATYSSVVTLLPRTPTVLAAGAAADVPGNTVTVPILFNPYPPSDFAAIQFDLVLPPSLTVAGITAGPAAVAATKTLSSNLSIPRAIIFGLDGTTIGPGIVAYVQLTINNSASPGPLAVGLTNVIGSPPFGVMTDSITSVQSGTVTVEAAGTPVITSTNSDTATDGSAYTYSITATHSPTSYNATGLPSWMSVDTTSGQLTGTPTPTDVGTSIITISATNGSGTGSATLALTVVPISGAPVIEGVPVFEVTENNTFPSSFTVTATNSPTSYNVFGSLPSGMTYGLVMSTPQITGIATATGVFPVTQEATNASGTGTAPLIILVVPQVPQITSTLSATGTVGQAFTYSMTASNSPQVYNAQALPAGLSINNSNGQLTGTPTVAGSFDVSLSAMNEGGIGNVSVLNITITTNLPVITSGVTDTATVGQLYSYQMTASNSPTGFIATGLPGGLSINTTTGLISGTPTGGGIFSINLSATNGFGTGSVTVLTLTVTPLPPVITSTPTAQGTVGSAFTYQIAATNTPTSFAASGLPSGLTVDTVTGLISGTPSVSGVTTASLSASNIGGTGTVSLTLTIASVNGTGSIHVYPNPWRADQHGAMPVTFNNLKPNSDVKIFTTSGYWVGTLHADSSSVTWDLKNDNGNRVASGLYYYRFEDSQGAKTTGELVIIR